LRIYHFINATYGLEAIQNRRIKVSRISSLNDPFEYLQYQTENHFARFLLKARRTEMNKSWGILCFSASYANPVQWAHYADAHRGICLGFEVPDDRLFKVEYVKSRAAYPEFQAALKFGPERFLQHMLSRKYDQWAYEQEHRMLHEFPKKLNSSAMHFVDFNAELELREVLLGARYSGDRRLLRTVLKDYDRSIRPHTVCASHTEFRMVKTGEEET
jgi:hypothetical protein